jgi:methyltransferase family protein
MEGLERHLAHQLEHAHNFFWHRLRWAAVSAYLPAGSFELVDVGAGIGLIGEFLRARNPGATYRFVEPMSFLEDELERRYGRDANVRHCDRYTGASVVTLLDVLEHQEDDRAFMRELAGKLDEGTTVVVTVPADQRLWSQWDVALGHHRRYDRQSFRWAVADAPLEVGELDYLFPELVAPALVRKVTRRSAEASPEAEFPELSPRLNELLYRIGSLSLRGRRVWPLGTSLLAVLKKR